MSSTVISPLALPFRWCCNGFKGEEGALGRGKGLGIHWDSNKRWKRNVLNQEEGGWCHLPTEVKGRLGLWGGGVCFLVVVVGLGWGVRTHLSTWETDSSDILNCCHTNSPVTLLPVTAEECWRWDYFKLPTGIESGFFPSRLPSPLALHLTIS